MPCWRTLLKQEVRWAVLFALAKAGRRRPANMAMMAITTSNSISVKALARGLEDFAALAMQFCTFIILSIPFERAFDNGLVIRFMPGRGVNLPFHDVL